MGFGVYRRRPDYERRPLRLPLAVAAVAAVGPTLQARAQYRQPERFPHETYRQRAQLPTVTTPVAPDVSVPVTQPRRPASVVRFDYETYRRQPVAALGVAAPALTVSGTLQLPRRAQRVEPTRLEHFRRQQAAFGVVAPAPGVSGALQLPRRIQLAPEVRHEYYQRPIVAPTVPPFPVPIATTVLQNKVRYRWAEFVRPWDYLRSSGKYHRRTIEPPAPSTLEDPVPASRGIYDSGNRGLYHIGQLPDNEPWGEYVGELNQSISHGSWVDVPMLSPLSDAGSVDSDAWSLLQADGTILIKRTGYYVVTANLDFGPALSGGVRILEAATRTQLIQTDGTIQRVFARARNIPDITAGVSDVLISVSSRQSPLTVGEFIRLQVEVITDTGASRNLDASIFGLRHVHSITPVGPVY